MNIFYLDRDPEIAAQMLCDKHIVKMILESAQLLSTAHHCYNDDNLELPCYKPYNPKHPCAIWIMSNRLHYEWLYRHFRAQSEEYTLRYDKVHSTYLKLNEFLSNAPKIQPTFLWQDPPLAMPPEYKNLDAVKAYRSYYIGEKLKFAKWTNREIPYWCKDDRTSH